MAVMVNTRLGLVVDEYLDSCAARGLSPKTLEQSYGYALRSIFLPWCSDVGLEELTDLDQRALDRFSAHLLATRGRKGRPLSRWSVKGYVLPVRHFLRWAQRQGLEVTGAEPQRVVTPKVVKEPPTRQEVQAMEDACELERDKLVIRLLADLGLRNGELRRLTIHDLVEHDRRWYLRVRGKGLGGYGMERMVPAPRLYRRLRRYIDHTRPKDCDSEALFLTVRRQRGEHRPIGEVQVENIVWSASRKAQIKRRMYPHLLRASAVTWMLSQGMNTYQVSSIVGNFSHLDSYYRPQQSDAYEALAALMSLQ